MKTLYLVIMTIPVFVLIYSVAPSLITTVSNMPNNDTSYPNEKPFPHAYGNCFPGCGMPEESIPSPSIGNRTIDVAIKLYSNSTASGIHYLQFRIFDANANNTIRHVSLMIVVMKNNIVLMRDLFHTHTGILTLKFNSSGTMGKWAVEGAREPILNGYEPLEDNQPVVVNAPVFNDNKTMVIG
ncbi:MAG: hypothetical protein ACRDFB_01790 [Rhabdochlamydiaceae bacterium]